MKLGIVGLPNVGKSTLFNAITSAGAEAANYPFCTIEPNVGVVAVPDERLPKLAALYDCKKIVYASVEFVDIAGLVKGASKGEGLGNKFLSHIRETDAIIHVVRCFAAPNVIHVDGGVDPARDMATVNLELILADLEKAEKQLERARAAAKGGDKKHLAEAELLEKVVAHLSAEKPVRTLKTTDGEAEFLAEHFYITAKKTLYAANISESDIGRDPASLPAVAALMKKAKEENAEVLCLSAAIEAELAALPRAEADAFLAELGLPSSGLDRLIKLSYESLNLISFLTAGEKETRAWTIERGTRAPQSAGKIHTDFERGFIRADIVPCQTLIDCGGYTAAKEKGKVISAGKDYVMQDGDVALFKFNV